MKTVWTLTIRIHRDIPEFTHNTVILNKTEYFAHQVFNFVIVGNCVFSDQVFTRL